MTQRSLLRSMWRWYAKRALVALASGALVGLLGGLAFLAWLPTAGGRAFAARRLERWVSGSIPGALRIGEIDELGWDGLRGRDVRFVDGEGEPVVEAERVSLAVDWLALATGRFVSPHGVARGGRVFLTSDAEGRLRIDRAFHSTDTGARPSGRDAVHFRSLDVSDVDVLVRVRGAPRAAMRGASATLDVRAPEGASVRFEADAVRGRAHIDAPIAIDLSVRGGHVSIDGDARRRARLALPCQLDGARSRVAVDVTARADDRMHVDLRIAPADVGSAIVTLPALAQALLAETGSDDLDVTIEGP